MRKAVCLLCIFCLFGAFAVTAEETTAKPELDLAAMKTMTKEQRLAHQKAYKQQLEDIARAEGWTPQPRDTNFKPADPQPAPKADGAKRVPGSSISYHSGTIGANGVADGVMVGNQFDTALRTDGTMCPTGCGPVEASGSITMATFSLQGASGNVFFSAYDQLAGTTANQITSASIPAAVGNNTHTFATALNYVGSSFLAGIWQFGGDSVGLATGTVAGQGFHAISINDGGVGMTFMTLGNANATMTISGNVATPVELMTFSVE